MIQEFCSLINVFLLNKNLTFSVCSHQFLSDTAKSHYPQLIWPEDWEDLWLCEIFIQPEAAVFWFTTAGNIQNYLFWCQGSLVAVLNLLIFTLWSSDCSISTMLTKALPITEPFDWGQVFLWLQEASQKWKLTQTAFKAGLILSSWKIWLTLMSVRAYQQF